MIPMSSLASALPNIIPYVQIGLSILLVVLVLVQRSDADVGGSFGGDGSGGTRFVRRGLEKTVFNLTIVIGILFVATALISIVVR